MHKTIYTGLEAPRDKQTYLWKRKDENGNMALYEYDGASWVKMQNGSEINSVSVSVDDTTGTPEASASIASGELSIAFSGLKGETGDKGDKGDQGNTGSSVDYPYELVNNRTTDDATKGLAAAEGKRLGDDINQLSQKVSLIGEDNALIASIVRTNSSGSREEVKTEIVAGLTYYISNSADSSELINFAFYDVNEEVIGIVRGLLPGYTLNATAPDNAVSVGIISYRSCVVTITTAGQIRLLREEFDEKVADLQGEIDGINAIFDGQSETHYTAGGYLKADNSIVEDATAGYSDYIPYQEGNAVLWKFDSQTKSYNLIFYDANKVRISTGWSAIYDSSVQGRLITAASIAQYHPNAAYIRASFTLGYQDASVAIGGVTAWVPETSDEGLIEKTDNLEQRVTDLENAPTPETIPSFVLTEGKATFNRLEEWAGGNSVFLLGQITDVHSGGNDKYKHIGYLNEVGVGYGLNLLVNGGDIGLDVEATSEAVDANNLIFDTKRQMSALNKWVFCKGNHERLEPTMKLGNAFNRGFAAVGNGYVFGSTDLSYGYIDDSVSKTRTIFLNSSDAAVGTHYGMTATQLQWLSGILSNVENGWKVVVVMHFMPNIIGKWNSDADEAYNYSFKALRELLSAFATHTSGSNTSYGLDYDFTTSGASLVCILCGDSHFNNFVKEGGVNYIVRQGYGYVADTQMPTGATRDNFNYNTQCLFDVLAVKDDGNAKVFRIGAGGSARDLAITY